MQQFCNIKVLYFQYKAMCDKDHDGVSDNIDQNNTKVYKKLKTSHCKNNIIINNSRFDIVRL